MDNARVDLLVGQLDMVWALFEHHAGAIDDEACLWEPAPGAWSVRPGVDGRWVADWEVPGPEPVPVTTVGWLTWHIGYWWTTTLGHCFGDGAPAREDIAWPGDAGAAVRWIGALKEEWRTALLGLADGELDSTERTRGLPWGEGLPLSAVAAWLNFELAKNVAEIGSVLHLRGALAAGGGRPTPRGGPAGGA
ncbi:DinB family protein [Streptomyces yaizuensis]|uniref:DinB family protein n=1 Tax=Streptomyces yaizuensis TaxID=2989713 RepID=A0ABQ5P4B4_9ACTN|nr:DinB family protein [Streptomyces sp. YSPA8]GLF97404.1 DinB family protein [Streptomyces sp. YSPA8]